MSNKYVRATVIILFLSFCQNIFIFAQPFIPITSNDLNTVKPTFKTIMNIEKTNFVVRDIFYLKFGHYKDAIALIDEAMKSSLMPPGPTMRVLTDFTGDAYRLILEQGFNTLADYEKSLSSELNAAAWKDWYEKFKPYVESSTREILKWVR
ncbi:MAG: hypothetical protein ABI761_03440 [Saprospiraceae bacterium]